MIAAPPANRRPFTATDWLLAAALVVATLAVYGRVSSYGFVQYDDQLYVANNPYVAQGLTWAGVQWAWTARVVGNWHPLTLWVELATSSLAGGPRPGPFHELNAVLQAVDVGLLFAVLRAATGRAGPAAAVAALWGLHPLRVESVAWLAELKDVLCGAMWLGCLLAYVGYARRGRRPAWYAAVIVLAALALLSKPTAVTLPFVLLLLDGWPLGDDRPAAGSAGWWGRRVAEKVPLFALSAATALIAVYSQGTGRPAYAVPLPDRLRNAAASTLAYLRDTVAPVHLGLFYPNPWVVHRPIAAVVAAAAAGVVAGVTAGVLLAARRRPYLAVGWLWFLGTLVPTLGLVQAGEQARADRFTFLPAMGLTIAAVWWAADWAAPSVARRRLAAAGGVCVAAALAVASWQLAASWRGVVTVFTRANAVIPDNYVARSMLANAAAAAGDLPRAEVLARSAVAVSTDRAAIGHSALAAVLDLERRPAEALAEYAEAVRLSPGDAGTRFRAAEVLIELDRRPKAVEQLYRVVKLDPTNVPARSALAVQLAATGRFAEAADQFGVLAALFPTSAQAVGNRADALRLAGDLPAAAAAYAAAVRLGTGNPQWQSELAWLTATDPAATTDRLRFAEPPARAAAARVDGDPFPPYALSMVLARLGQFDDATAAARVALDRATAAGQRDRAADIRRRLAAYGQGSLALPVRSPASTGPGR